MKKLYWSRCPGKVVDRLNKEEFKIVSFNGTMLDWYKQLEIFLEEIKSGFYANRFNESLTLEVGEGVYTIFNYLSKDEKTTVILRKGESLFNKIKIVPKNKNNSVIVEIVN